jgi:hypothetical protein
VNLNRARAWRREALRAGLPLALLALIVQAVVAFGHHHFDLLAPAHPVAKAAGAQVGYVVAGRDERRDRHAPALPDDDACLVCQTLHAGATPAIDAPQPALPVEHGGTAMPRRPSVPLAAVLRTAAFHSRAPPPARHA